MDAEPRELILLTKAQQAVAQARTIDEVKDLRDRAEAVRAYAKKARLGKHIVVEASAIKVHAERKLGQMLKDLELAKAAPGNQYTGNVVPSDDDGPVRLADLGITKSDSSRAQRIAGLPEDAFNSYLADNVQADCQPTTAGLLRLVKQRQAQSQTNCPVPPIGGDVVSTIQELLDAGRQFATIYADPPWPYNNRATRAAATNHYPTMTLEKICGEPVEQLCE